MGQDPIYVTRPYLPPLAELIPMLEEIWESRILTNHGPFHQRLEDALAASLNVAHVSLMANGMAALEAAIAAADIRGEVITTPFSFVATTHAIQRAGLTPVFADIRRGDLNIDPRCIEAMITDRTSAIVAVHCYGNPCAIDEIERIAAEHQLKVIYDAAHAFGARWRGDSLASFGDLSILSFHATKLFNTFEGGAVVAKSPLDQQQVAQLRNFGIIDEVTVAVAGTNAKMSEFNAALGLLQLQYADSVIAARAKVDQRYRDAFATIEGIEPLAILPGTNPNHAYFPVLVTEDFPVARDQLYEAMKAKGVYGRRYFYPLIAGLPMYRDLPSADLTRLPVAVRAAKQILCLPIYPDLEPGDQDRVIEAIRDMSS